MNRISFAVIACVLILCPLSVHAQTPDPDPADPAPRPTRRGTGVNGGVEVRINGDVVQFAGQPPIEERGRVLVPLRGVLEKLGAFVEYDSVRRSVTAIRGRTTILLTIGETAALVNERAIELDAPARTVGGSVMVPLRFVAESLGARVRYNDTARLVEIATGVDTPPGPANNGNSLSGTVLATYPNLKPRRFVLRIPPVQTGDEATERTIPLAREVTVVLRQGSGIGNFDFARITRGDRLRVRLNADDEAEAITVQGDGGDDPQPLPPPRPSRPGEDDPLPSDTARGVRGTILRIDRISAAIYGVTLTNGKTVRVPRAVPVTYQGQRIALSDLQPGDTVTILQDIQTQRGTKITVSGVR